MHDLQDNTAGIFSIQWHITEKCNLRCSHCYQDNYSGSGELDLAGLKKIADEIINTLSKWGKSGYITITGGEPLVKNETFDLINYLGLFSETAGINILTNGTLINEEVIKRIIQSEKIRNIQISLDGAGAKTHDSIRGKNAFKKALTGIRLLRKHNIPVNVMFTLQRSNINEIPSLIDLVKDEGVNNLTIERFVPMGTGNQKKKELLSAEEVKNVFTYVSDRAQSEIEKAGLTNISRSRPLWALCDRSPCGNTANKSAGTSVGGVCSIGLDGLCILPDFSVLPCRRLPITLGNLKDDTLSSIWHRSKLLWEIADKRNLKGKCSSCEFVARCSGCRAMAFACTGDYLAEDPQCFK